MSTDPELDRWQQEWRSETEPLPELRRKIRRQDVRAVAGFVALVLALAAAIALAVLQPSAFHDGLVAGIAVAGVGIGAYTVRVRRGTWTPAAETTRAYAELSLHRALAQAKILRVSLIGLLVAIVIVTGSLALTPGPVPMRGRVIALLMVLEVGLFVFQGRRVKRDVASARQLLDSLED